MSLQWTQEQVWKTAPKFTLRSFQETVDGGQAFRWHCKDSVAVGQWADIAVRLRHANDFIMVSFPKSLELEAIKRLEALDDYFAVKSSLANHVDSLPWRSDSVLALSIQAFPELRILRQPFSETLFCFLCSSTKQIPQIKAICELVARDQGKRIAEGMFALPDWRSIAANGELRLRQAKLGYRARYIYQTACLLADRPDYFDELEKLPTHEARSALMQLPGVGRKIADCTLLFGAGRLDAFPIDTWIEKILIRSYQLEGWSSKQLQKFASVHFGENAGLAQQFLFSAARAGLIADRS